MPSRNARRPVLVVALAAGLATSAACGDDPAAAPANAAVPTTGTPAPTTPSTGAPAPGKAGRTPGGTAAAWVTDILTENYPAACGLMAVPGKPGPVDCTSDQVTRALTTFHGSWVKPGIPLPPQVRVTVAKVKPHNKLAKVPDTAVRVGEHTLHELIMIGATPDADVSLTIELHRTPDGWRVTDVNIGASVGSTPTTTR